MRRWWTAVGAALAVLLVLAGATAVARAWPPGARAVPGCPEVVAHRTAMLDAPENTLPGIAAAAGSGAGGVELDVQWSSSGFPVLMHDATVDRTTNGTGTPASLGLGQLRALWAAAYPPWQSDPRYADTRVSYGWEFMDAARDARLDVLVDVHAAPTELGTGKLAYYISSVGWADRTVVMASEPHVAAMRGWEPGLRYVLIEYQPTGRIRSGESLRALGVAGIAVPAKDATAAAVAYWHQYVPTVIAWSSDSPSIDTTATWAKLRAAGVDVLVTNEPAAALAAQAADCG